MNSASHETHRPEPTVDRPEPTFGGKTVQEWREGDPVIDALADLRETAWLNPGVRPVDEALPDVGLTAADVADAAARLRRFAPFIARVFPETTRTGGILESPLVGIENMCRELSERYGSPYCGSARDCLPGPNRAVNENHFTDIPGGDTSVPRALDIPGSLWAKLDSELPVSGSIKARGGIYEVLKHAEDLALDHGLLTLTSDYSILAEPVARDFFGRYKIAVGSTGNLGLSIGIMGAALGFQVTVHMSADARAWKKEMLRKHGVTVVEYESDYSVAVAAGRREADSDPATYFIDNENSVNLFLGYAVAGHRLAGQLQALDIRVDDEHPLFVYLPCGVGGGPGGVAFGLKAEFGDAVHCIFAEPTHAPCMILGVKTGLHEQVSVQDFGIDGVTAADGLAVGRPSGFVGRRMERLIDGYYTIDDDELYRHVALLHRSEGIAVEPSAAAGLSGVLRVLGEVSRTGGVAPSSLKNATHIAWCTGGSMVPREEMEGYLRRGEELL